MKNECGHPVSSENSYLRCDDCDSEARLREDVALWNAAIEAAARALETTYWPTDSIGDELRFTTETIRALKREAK